jgi:DUF971 family protein
MSVPAPVKIRLRTKSRVLDVSFDDGASYELPAEYLRVHSPSAEVQGHSAGEGVLVTGKESVGIRAVEPVGLYAVRLVFDDGHDTGLYTWKDLRELGSERDARWQTYLRRLEQAGHKRREAPPTGA